jgi:hypothetical protein
MPGRRRDIPDEGEVRRDIPDEGEMRECDDRILIVET